ncbi:MAG TPA: GNAT family N-acetyltransferase, partial [Clostridia bacterium]|nr:GNAT family N-acetyltransferase [Clostridia bacterium]
KSLMIAAFVGGRLAANCGINCAAPYKKYQHRAEFGIAVLEEFWGNGIASALLTEIIAAARAMGYEQMELEVVTENTKAIALYKRFGFEIFGTRERSFKYLDGSFASEHLMLLKL